MIRPTWDAARVEQLAPDAKSIVASRKLLKEKRFSSIEATADGLGWWAKCHGQTGEYEVSARHPEARSFSTTCTCPSYKQPCKHALAFLILLAERGEELPQAEVKQSTVGGDYESLLMACFNHPEDDLARLVLADYLEERGEDDRARLMRLHIEPPTITQRGKGMADKEEAKLVKKLLATLPNMVEGEFGLRRGFLHYRTDNIVAMSASKWPASLVTLFQQGHVESVELTGWLRGIPPAAVRILHWVGEVRLMDEASYDQGLVAAANVLPLGEPESRLVRVVVPDHRRERWEKLLAEAGSRSVRMADGDLVLTDPSPGRLARQVAARAFQGVERVSVVGSQTVLADRMVPHGGTIPVFSLTTEVASILAGCPDLANAQEVIFRDIILTVESAAALADSDWRTSDITFSGIQWAPGAIDAWLDLAWVSRAVRLNLYGSVLFGEAELEALTTRHFPRLRILEIQDYSSSLPAGTARRLIESPGLQSIDVLEVFGEAFDPTSALALRFDPVSRHIECLRLAGMSLRLHQPPDCRKLSLEISPYDWPSSVAVLEGWSEIGEVVVAGPTVPLALLTTLAACFPDGLPSLTLSQCRLRVAEAKALAAVLPVLRPTKLDLSHNLLGLGGMRVLVKGGLHSVEELDLACNPLTNAAIDLLSPAQLGNLKHLVLRDTLTAMTRHDQAKFQKKLGNQVTVEW